MLLQPLGARDVGRIVIGLAAALAIGGVMLAVGITGVALQLLTGVICCFLGLWIMPVFTSPERR